MTPEQELKAKLEACIADHKAITANREKLEQELAELEAAKKPKLRHGDIFPVNGTYQVVLKRNNSLEVFGDESGSGVSPTADWPDLKSRVGNIKDYFDDLKALQEDVTEFEIEEYKDDLLEYLDDLLNINPFIVADQEHEGFIEIKDLSDNQKVHVAYADLPRLYNGLRAIEATIKRNEL
jgi:hypothetical protein